MDYKGLIKGTYDLHVHSAPDVLLRKTNDTEMVQWIKENGMAGYAIKSHYFCISERVGPINKLYPDCDAVGTVTLNSPVDGISPTAVEMVVRNGVKLVWFPTYDSTHEIAHVFDGNPNKKLPYWVWIIIQMREAGTQAPVIHILEEDGTLKKPVMDVLDIIAKYDMILATGHVSHEEAFALVKETKNRGVKKIVVTHVDFPTTYYTVEEQKWSVEMGVVMKHYYTIQATGKVEFGVTKEMICKIGPASCILVTGLGQKTAPYPDEGLLELARRLYDNGFTAEETRTTAVDNLRALLGK